LIAYCLVAILEDVLLRGMLLRILEEGLGSWIALTSAMTCRDAAGPDAPTRG
jgi:membrane protease YdiL (CAAX protease family)